MFPADAKHLVVGFGITGLSIVKALKALNVKHIWALDSRENPPNYAEIAPLCEETAVGGFSTALLDQCDYLWLSPGVALATPELQSTLVRLPQSHIGGDIELFARLVEENIIAITGTNGKSTVTTLLGAIFAETGYDLYVGGNLGLPALELWLQYQSRDSADLREPLFILELSSFQLETTTSLKADVGVLLNLSPDHLDRYRDYEHYITSKFRLFAQSNNIMIPAGSTAIEADLMAGMADHRYQFELGKDSIYRFALTDRSASDNDNEQVDYWADLESKMIISREGERVSFRGSHLGGLHNVLNMIAATGAAEIFGASLKAIETGITNYQPLAHRTVKVRTLDGVTYYNDSKATNISSTEAAILGFPERKWVILGGVTKGQDFSILETLLTHNVAGVALIGADYSTILPHIPKNLLCFKSGTLMQAIEDIRQEAAVGDIVLFSPACASFDQFRGFEHRGEVFEAFIQAL